MTRGDSGHRPLWFRGPSGSTGTAGGKGFSFAVVAADAVIGVEHRREVVAGDDGGVALTVVAWL